MRLSNNRGSWSLIGLLVAVLIVVVAAAIYFGGNNAPSGSTVGKKNAGLLDEKSQKNTVFGKAIDTGKASDCKQRLIQIRAGIENYKAMGTSEANPPTFKDMGLGVSNDYFQCPVSSKPYTYDPAAGAVKCPTHDSF